MDERESMIERKQFYDNLKKKREKKKTAFVGNSGPWCPWSQNVSSEAHRVKIQAHSEFLVPGPPKGQLEPCVVRGEAHTSCLCFFPVHFQPEISWHNIDGWKIDPEPEPSWVVPHIVWPWLVTPGPRGFPTHFFSPRVETNYWISRKSFSAQETLQSSFCISNFCSLIFALFTCCDVTQSHHIGG